MGGRELGAIAIQSHNVQCATTVLLMTSMYLQLQIKAIKRLKWPLPVAPFRVC